MLKVGYEFFQFSSIIRLNKFSKTVKNANNVFLKRSKTKYYIAYRVYLNISTFYAKFTLLSIAPSTSRS